MFTSRGKTTYSLHRRLPLITRQSLLLKDAIDLLNFGTLQTKFLYTNYKNTITIQDCIPVGCVPPACWPYLPACTAHGGGGVAWSWGCLVPGRGVPDLRSRGGGVCSRGYPSMHWGRTPPPLWTEWLTDRCKNITFANFVCGR